MITHVDQSLQDLLTIDFPASFEYRDAKVMVSPAGRCYDVSINGEFIDQIVFDGCSRSWIPVRGNLNDCDLIVEIGERIEARYN
jgi:hypothetical protein